MKVKYERVYYADVREAVPTPEVRKGAESQIPFLIHTRKHVLYATQGLHFRRQLATSDGWRVTYTPEVVK